MRPFTFIFIISPSPNPVDFHGGERLFVESLFVGHGSVDNVNPKFNPKFLLPEIPLMSDYLPVPENPLQSE